MPKIENTGHGEQSYGKAKTKGLLRHKITAPQKSPNEKKN